MDDKQEDKRGIILLVEDEELVRDAYRMALEVMGFQVYWAENYSRAEALIQKVGLDCVITDIFLPDATGIDILDRIGKVQPSTPVVVITGRPAIGTALEAIKLKAFDYLIKPIDLEDLMSTAVRAVALKKELDNKKILEERKEQYTKELETMVTNSARQLHKSEEMYRHLFEQSKDGIFVLRQSGEFVDVNQAMLDDLGYDLDSLLEKNFGLLLRDRSAWPGLWAGIRERGYIRDFQVELVTRTGETVDSLITIDILREDDGREAGYHGVMRNVTEQKLIEQKIREQKEFLENVLESLTNPFVIVNPRTCRVELANTSAMEHNFSIGKACYEVYHLAKAPYQCCKEPCPIELILSTRKPVVVEHIHLDPAGQPRHHEVHGYPVFDEIGGVGKVILYTNDITEKRITEKALIKSEAKFRDFFFHSPVMMQAVDEQGNLIDVNSKWVEETGYSREEVCGMPVDFLLRPERYNERSVEDLKTFFRSSVKDAHCRYIRKDGTLINVLVNSKMTTDSNNNNICLSVVHNITEHVQTLRQLNRLQTAVEQLADGVIITDLTGLILYVNPAFVIITGRERTEVYGQPFPLDPSVESRGIYEEMWAAARLRKIWKGQITGQRKDGTKYSGELTVSPVIDKNGDLVNFVAVLRDITEQRRLESIAAADNLMQNIGFVFSGIRHEVGNPINSIKTTLTALDRRLASLPAETIQNFIKGSLQEISRVEYLLNSLKNFSLFDRLQPATVELDDFIKQFQSIISKDFQERRIKVSTRFSPEKKYGRIDVRAFHHVLLNILTNAADALVGRDNPEIKISTLKAFGFLEIAIEDNGRGMTELEQSTLFQPFYTAKSHGTGLGLVIVKKMIVQMDGTISISSEKDVGTTVQITIPEVAHEPLPVQPDHVGYR